MKLEKNYKFTIRLLNILLILGIIALFYFINPLVQGITSKVISIATPFLIALVFAMATYPLIEKLKNETGWSSNKSKNISIVIVLISMIMFFIILVPLLIDVIKNSLPSLKNIYDNNLKTQLDNIGIDISAIMKYINVGNIAGSIASAGTNFLLVVILYLFIVIDIEKTRTTFKAIIYNTKKKKLIKFVKVFDNNFNNYIKALVLYSGAAIIFYALSILLLSLPWTYSNIFSFPWYMFGILFGILVVIPYIGPAIGILIASLSMLKFGQNATITMVVGIIIAMQIDANFIQLKIIGSKMKVHPLLVISTITISSSILGFAGVLISPILLIFNKTLLDIYLEDIKKASTLETNKEVSLEIMNPGKSYE